MSNIFEKAYSELSLAEQRVVKYGVATVVSDAASTLSTIATEGDAYIAEIPALADDVLKAAETAAAKFLSAEESAQVNGVLAAFSVDLTAEATKIAQAVLGVIPKVVAAMQNYAAKLRSEADATKSQG